MLLPESLQSLINALERLPGIGPKSASRLAFYFLRAPEEVSQDLASALANLKANTTLCQECFNITEAGRERCEICESPQRDGSLVCVVEEALDVLALERTGGYRGKYHVLQGVLSPIEGIGPDDLKIKQLIAQATRAPYGRGEETILDELVRKVWQMPPAQVRLGGKSWGASFENILRQVVAELGCEGMAVSAELLQVAGV